MPFLSSSLSSAQAWLRRKRLSSEHKATLRAYRAGNFSNLHAATISVGDALKEKILHMHELKHDNFVQVAPTLDERVWTEWNEYCLGAVEAYKHFYGTNEEGLKTRFASVYRQLMPFERLVDYAMEQNNVSFLAWLHALDNPWRTFEWQPAEFLGQSIQMSEWALSTFDSLKLNEIQTRYLVQQYLWHPEDTPRHPTSLDWMRNVGKKLFVPHLWPSDSDDAYAQREHIAYMLDAVLPPKDWPWERRWEEFGSGMRVAASPYEYKGSLIPVPRVHGALIAALMHEAPEEVQMAMCALKDAVHPNEPPQGHPDPQYIRHHFFDGPPPTSAPSSLISTTFLFVGGVDPSVEGKFVLEQVALGDTPRPAPESYELPPLDF